MRNDLLADIVTASGGTITDRNNRNLLLKDWLEAVKASAVNYVARLNGTDQYWQLSEEVFIPIGGTVELDIMYAENSQASNDYLIANFDSLQTALYLTGVGVLDVWDESYLDNISVDGAVSNTLIYDGSFHNVSAESTGGNTKVGLIGARFTLERLNSGVIKSFIVRDAQGAILNKIPLTNKAQGATQLATVGNVNATMVGYNNDVWEQV